MVSTDELVINASRTATRVHFAPTFVGSELFRIIYDIWDTREDELVKHYEIWVSLDYASDQLKTPQRSANQKEIRDFADSYLFNRYKHNKDIDPGESGALLTHMTGEVRGNPNTFPFKLDKNDESKKDKLETVSVVLPQKTWNYIQNHGKEKNLSYSEVITMCVGAYQAGTASLQNYQESNQQNSRKGLGAATGNE